MSIPAKATKLSQINGRLSRLLCNFSVPTIFRNLLFWASWLHAAVYYDLNISRSSHFPGCLIVPSFINLLNRICNLYSIQYIASFLSHDGQMTKWSRCMTISYPRTSNKGLGWRNIDHEERRGSSFNMPTWLRVWCCRISPENSSKLNFRVWSMFLCS